jgi:nicotinamidase-related amidase
MLIMKKNQKPALLIIDMINDFNFTHGQILSQKTTTIMDSILNLKDYFYKRNWPVIYINDHYKLWKADLESLIQHCTNERSQSIINKIAPCDEDYFLIKPKHSAFYGTALEPLLQELKVDALVLTGIAGNICVLFTANDAYMREYSLHVPQDCIASNNDKDNAYALTMMKEVLKANIEPSTIIYNP